MTMKYRLGKSFWRTLEEGTEREWMIANGIGGFSNCSVIGNLSRVQSAYLVAALNPPVDRISILSNIKEKIIVGNKTFDLGCQTYGKGNTEGFRYLESFTHEIVPTYTYQMDDIRMNKKICLEHGKNTVVVRYEIINGIKNASLGLLPTFACRDNNNSALSEDEIDISTKIDKDCVVLINNNDDRYIVRFSCSDGDIIMRQGEKQYEKGRTYLMDLKNGYSYEDIGFTPIDVNINLLPYEKKIIYIKCTIEELDDKSVDSIINDYNDRVYGLLDRLKYRDKYIDRLAISADTFIVDRKSTGLKTIVAGYPWFADWGRDTMIALQGTTLCTGRFEDTRAILESFAKNIRNGLIPNLFSSYEGEEPKYNTVDASLWYFYSVDRYLEYTGSIEDYDFIKERIYPVLKQIINAYYEGTDYSIGMKEDSLISAGRGFDQVTWMDVRVDDWVVTPRHGKPVEINALWYNALKVMEKLSKRYNEDSMWYTDLSCKVKESFCQKFWNEDKQCLFDVVDENDDKIRPNQIWAVSLPYTMLDNDKEKKIINTVYKYLYTCYGLRTLSYTDKEFKESYSGDLSDRDAAYHMGTVWPFPLGGFITAYCKVNNYSKEAIERARQMCEACFDHLEDGCLNAISEVFDGMNPCSGNGCYNQAWSVGEMLRAYYEDVICRG